jgi:hypothetical protein
VHSRAYQSKAREEWVNLTCGFVLNLCLSASLIQSSIYRNHHASASYDSASVDHAAAHDLEHMDDEPGDCKENEAIG